MQTSATNRRIRVLITAIKSGQLVARPEFQRRLVWTNKHKQEFIRTVLLEYPFPEIYVAAGHVNLGTGEGTEMLVDGQQRLATLVQYFSGAEDMKLGGVRPYTDLTDEEKKKFLEYDVVVRDMGAKSIEEIKEVFTRINSTKYSLNAMEVHNARFDGAFKQFGEWLAAHSFFEENRVFRTNDIRRMGDLTFCLTVVISMLTTYFNRDDDLGNYLEKYNDEFPERERLQEETERVLAFVSKCKLGSASRTWHKADLLSLLVEVHRALIRNRLPLEPNKVRERLLQFYSKVDDSAAGREKAEDVTKYHTLTRQASNDRSSRIARGETIYRVLTGQLAFS